VRKFIRFLLSVNFKEIFLILSSVLLRLPLPLLPVQILWINLITDGPPALALASDPYSKDLMKRKPREPKEGIFHGMLLFILAAALLGFLLQIFLFIYWASTEFVSLAKIRTMIFTSVVFFELFFVFNSRSESRSVFKIGIGGNRKLLLAVLLSILLQLMVIYLPALQPAFGTVPLSLGDWALVLTMGLSGLLIVPEIFMR
jgi:Ca2+-transporting ATPase